MGFRCCRAGVWHQHLLQLIIIVAVWKLVGVEFEGERKRVERCSLGGSEPSPAHTGRSHSPVVADATIENGNTWANRLCTSLWRRLCAKEHHLLRDGVREK